MASGISPPTCQGAATVAGSVQSVECVVKLLQACGPCPHSDAVSRSLVEEEYRKRTTQAQSVSRHHVRYL